MLTSTRAQTRHQTKIEIAKYAVSLTVLGLGVATFLFLKSLAKPPATQASNALIQQVDTYEVQPYFGLLDLVVTGSVVPHREIKIASQVSGRIAKKYDACEAGTFVRAGEPLLEIDDEEYQLEIKTLEAEVLQSQKRIEENDIQIEGEKRNIELANNDLSLQQKEFGRRQRLSNVLSQTELDQSQMSLNSSRTQLTTRENNLAGMEAATARLNAALELARRQLDKAKLNLSYTMITAPDDGIIVRELVQKGDFVSKGTHIITFEDPRKSEVLCNLTPNDLAWIRSNSTSEEKSAEKSAEETTAYNFQSVYQIPKTDVTIFDPSDPAVTWHGTLERFDGIGRDDVTKTFPCRIVVSNPIIQTEQGPRALVRGMYVKCRVEVQTTSNKDHQQLLSFPAVALHPDDHVWVVKNEKLNRIDVHVVDRTETTVNDHVSKIVVVKTEANQLRAGDKIVTSPLSQPNEGAPVMTKESL